MLDRSCKGKFDVKKTPPTFAELSYYQMGAPTTFWWNEALKIKIDA